MDDYDTFGFWFFHTEDEPLYDVRIRFGQRRGSLFDVIMRGLVWLPADADGDEGEVAVTGHIDFTGVHVDADTEGRAREIMEGFCDSDAFVAEPVTGAFRFSFRNAAG